jgi:hypothetical protein
MSMTGDRFGDRRFRALWGTRMILGRRASNVNVCAVPDMRRGGGIDAFHSNPPYIISLLSKSIPILLVELYDVCY